MTATYELFRDCIRGLSKLNCKLRIASVVMKFGCQIDGQGESWDGRRVFVGAGRMLGCCGCEKQFDIAKVEPFEVEVK